jgi:hypothetical protein
MSLVRIGNALVRSLFFLGRLARSCLCCESWCCRDYSATPDDCGNFPWVCVDFPGFGCVGPFKRGQCDCPEPEKCCNEDEDCGPCECCASDNKCIPCVCETDADCPENYCCDASGCCIPCDDPPPPPPPPPANWYCCYEETGTEPSLDPENDQPGRRRTICQEGPCATPEQYASGPHTSAETCAASCRPHQCRHTECCNSPDCFPDDDGPHDTKEACEEACDTPPPNPCSIGPSGDLRKTGGTGTFVYEYDVNCEPGTGLDGDGGVVICLAYVSKSCFPIRVQILSDLLSDDGSCVPVARDVVVLDSRWRGQCTCNAQRAVEGGPTGFLRWRTKQRGITKFKVRVFAPCSGDWEFALACDTCPVVDSPSCCPLAPCVPVGDGPPPCCEQFTDENGNECTQCVECGEGLCCQDGECKPCPEGQCCENGACVPCCQDDSDCPDDKCCEDNECVPCCDSNDDCGPTECCVNQECVPCCNFQPCVTSADCAEGCECNSFAPAENTVFIPFVVTQGDPAAACAYYAANYDATCTGCIATDLGGDFWDILCTYCVGEPNPFP